MSPFIEIATLVVSAVGLGMQYDANKTAAANQAAMAEYNYAVQEQNIKQQQAIAQQQANYQARYQEAQGMIARQQADSNAQAYDFQADATLRQGREAASRTREDHLRAQARMAAGMASGNAVLGTGSFLMAAVKGAEMQALAASDAWYETNNQYMALRRASALERWGGSVDAAGYGAQAALSRYEGSLSPIKARMQKREAEYDRLAGLNRASTMRSMATAGLVSGFGTVLGSGFDMGVDAGWIKPSTAKTASTS